MGCGQSALAADASPKRKQTRKHVPRVSDTGGKQSGSESSVDRSRSSRGSKRGGSRNGSRSSKGSKGGKDWWSNVSGASTGSGESNGRPIRRSQSDHFADRLVVNASKTNVADMYDIGHTLGAESTVSPGDRGSFGCATHLIGAPVLCFRRHGVVRGREVRRAQGDASAGELQGELQVKTPPCTQHDPTLAVGACQALDDRSETLVFTAPAPSVPTVVHRLRLSASRS